MKPIQACRAAVTATLLALAVPLTSTAAVADPAMQARVDAVIAQYGGTQTDWNEVSWPDEGVVLDLSPTSPPANAVAASTQLVPHLDSATASATASCSSGTHCVYSGATYTGNRISYSSCSSSQSVAALGGSVQSIYNARSNKTIKAYNGSTVVATVSANSGKNVSGTITKIGCS